MAEEDGTKKQENQEEPKEEPKEEKSDKKSLGSRFLPWIIMAVIVGVCAGTGFGLGRLFGGSRTDKPAEPSQENKSTLPDLKADDNSATDSQQSWYYDLEPVVANLDVPGITRYVRAAITLEISTEMDKQKYTAFLDEEKKPVLTNWLTIYLASLTLEDIRGDGNLRRIQSQILDAFNEKLFPDARPQIKHILFKEFAIQ